MSFTTALFDLDGTLLDTLPDLSSAVNAMRTQLELSALSHAVIASYVGEGVEVLIQRALTDSFDQTPTDTLLQTGRALFYDRYHAVNGDNTQIYPGVLEGLKAFAALNMQLAVVTNKSTEFTLPLLQRTGLAGFFEHIVCGDTCSRKKPDPMPLLHACDLCQSRPQNTVFIGDSINDAQAARAAGMPVLLVPYGYSPKQDVHQLDVDAIVSSISSAACWVEGR